MCLPVYFFVNVPKSYINISSEKILHYVLSKGKRDCFYPKKKKKLP